jgi:hypothetical protein
VDATNDLRPLTNDSAILNPKSDATREVAHGTASLMNNRLLPILKFPK